MPLIVLLLAVAFVAHFAWILAAFATVAAVGWLVGKSLARHCDLAQERGRRDAEISARADRQHAAVLAGNELVGWYGDYPPAQT